MVLAPPATTEPILRRDDQDGVATLTLNRPSQFNALSVALLEALKDALAAIAADPSVRVVVLAGSGKAFCAGHDLKEMRGDTSAGTMGSLFRLASDAMLAIARMPQPVIAQVHGVAAAAGCQLVAACDLAVAAEGARFAVSGINVGLFCGTPSVALGRNMGRKQALEMLLTGEFIDAAEAQRRGLVNRVVPLDQVGAEVKRLTDSICAKSPTAIALGKALFYQQLEQGLEAAYDLATEAMVRNTGCGDVPEGIDAFLEKRPARWLPR